MMLRVDAHRHRVVEVSWTAVRLPVDRIDAQIAVREDRADGIHAVDGVITHRHARVHRVPCSLDSLEILRLTFAHVIADDVCRHQPLVHARRHVLQQLDHSLRPLAEPGKDERTPAVLMLQIVVESTLHVSHRIGETFLHGVLPLHPRLQRNLAVVWRIEVIRVSKNISSQLQRRAQSATLVFIVDILEVHHTALRVLPVPHARRSDIEHIGLQTTVHGVCFLVPRTFLCIVRLCRQHIACRAVGTPHTHGAQPIEQGKIDLIHKHKF